MEKICCIGHITRDKIVTPSNTVYMAGGVAFYFSYAINQLPKLVDYTLATNLTKESLCIDRDTTSARKFFDIIQRKIIA